jgi:hypothetical protein
VGARPTDAMGPILKRAGITDKFVKMRSARKSKSAAKEEAEKKPETPSAS